MEKKYKERCRHIIDFVADVMYPHLHYTMKKLKSDKEKFDLGEEREWRQVIVDYLTAINSLDMGPNGKCAQIQHMVGSNKNILNCEECEIKKIYKKLVEEYKATLH